MGNVLWSTAWLDAPIGYISATKQWAANNGKNWKDYGEKEDSKLIHFIGKDNIVFHCVIFPGRARARGTVLTPTTISVAKRARSLGVRSWGAPMVEGSASGTSSPSIGIVVRPDRVALQLDFDALKHLTTAARRRVDDEYPGHSRRWQRCCPSTAACQARVHLCLLPSDKVERRHVARRARCPCRT